MIWIKYRHKSAAGPSEWEYEDVSYAVDGDGKLDLEFIQETTIEQIEYDHGYFEKYYGVEWEVVDKPPKDVVIDRIRFHQGVISHSKKSLDVTEKYLIDNY